MRPNGNRYGTHRVVEPLGTLPQPAHKLDNSMEIYDNELLIDVSTLNIDSASYTQIRHACSDDAEQMRKMILSIVDERGKMQNPVTGSGGMLIGTVREIGPKFHSSTKVKVGDRIATLVSLSLTPLKINAIKHLDPQHDQVDVDAQAILFESGLFAVLPDDIPERLALAALDVAGAPAQVDRLVTEGDIVCLIGGGKSGILCCYQAMQNVGPYGKVIVVEYSQQNAQRILDMGLATDVIVADATNVMDVYNKVMAITGGRGTDVTINNVNVPNTEMTSILITKGRGCVYFFSMATSFTRAALGAEGVGKDINLIVGNGFARGHAELTLNILRESEPIRQLFEQLYA